MAEFNYDLPRALESQETINVTIRNAQEATQELATLLQRSVENNSSKELTNIFESYKKRMSEELIETAYAFSNDVIAKAVAEMERLDATLNRGGA